MTTASPAAIRASPSSVSAVAVRRKWMTGVAQRTISSAAGPISAGQQIPLRRVVGEGLDAVAGRIARRVVAGGREEHEDAAEQEVVQRLAVDPRVHERGPD